MCSLPKQVPTQTCHKPKALLSCSPSPTPCEARCPFRFPYQQTESQHVESYGAVCFYGHPSRMVGGMRSNCPGRHMNPGPESVPGLINRRGAVETPAVQQCSLPPGAPWVVHALAATGGDARGNGQRGSHAQTHLLCLSNGHGEDAVAVAVLEKMRDIVEEEGRLHISALPLVGLGAAYAEAGVPTIGDTQVMPSGGFIYMDGKQLVGDIRAGLASLTLRQWAAVRKWAEDHPGGSILAVGDVFPLAMAWLASKASHMAQPLPLAPPPPWALESGAAPATGKHMGPAKKGREKLRFAFVGTAKSEYYLRGEDGKWLERGGLGRFEPLLQGKSVYYPWERFVMADPSCRLVAPRDGLTSRVLKEALPPSARDKVRDLGNPMMDGLDSKGLLGHALLRRLCSKPDVCLALLPGSRPPEVHANWRLVLRAVDATLRELAPRSCLLLAPVVPSLGPQPFAESLEEAGWTLVSAAERAAAGSPSSAEAESCQLARAGDAAGGGGAHQAGQPSGRPFGPQTTTLSPRQEEVAVDEGLGGPIQWPDGADEEVPLLVFRRSPGRPPPAADPPLLVLTRGAFADCISLADGAIAMAGTATEQVVGLGKPAFTLAGAGPQFSTTFAEAQTRLLGPSVILSPDVNSLAGAVAQVMGSASCLAEIAENGQRRLGVPGAASRVAKSILDALT